MQLHRNMMLLIIPYPHNDFYSRPHIIIVIITAGVKTITQNISTSVTTDHDYKITHGEKEIKRN